MRRLESGFDRGFLGRLTQDQKLLKHFPDELTKNKWEKGREEAKSARENRAGNYKFSFKHIINVLSYINLYEG